MNAGYGDQPRFLDGLEIRGLPYLVGVASTTASAWPSPRTPANQPRRTRTKVTPTGPPSGNRHCREANALLEELLQDAWQAITWREVQGQSHSAGLPGWCRGKPLPTAGWLIQRPLPGHRESKYCSPGAWTP